MDGAGRREQPVQANFYTGNPLDRAAARREDAAWLAEALAAPGSRFLPLAGGKVRIADTAAARLAAGEIGADPAALPWVFLGLEGARALFAVEVTGAGAGADGFVELRPAFASLAAAEAALLAQARALLHWRARQRFCGACGKTCRPRSGGHVMVCEGCATQHFPRTDPAVIMLVARGERALLGHAARFPRSDMYSTLAGFVEPGESLEEAVRREVREETGVDVGQVRYHSSQPWPFPASLMLGFLAEAASEEIVIDPEELTDARWFDRAELVQPQGFSLPPADSIARRLIEDWVAGR